MIGLVLFLLLGLAIAWTACVAYTAWMLTHPPRRTYASAVARGKPGDPSEMPRARQFSSWMFRSRGRDLPVWDIAGDGSDGPVVVMTHGWGDSRLGSLARLEAVAPLASRIIAWDLPGHGEAPGICALGAEEWKDLDALVQELRTESRAARDLPVVLYGWSLGAGVSMAAACNGSDFAGVIAESPYRYAISPARNVLRLRKLPHRPTLGPAFALLRILLGKGITMDRAQWTRDLPPVLVLQGSNDEISPAAEARFLADRAGGRLVEIDGAGHNNLWTDPRFAADCARAVQEYIRSLAHHHPAAPVSQAPTP